MLEFSKILLTSAGAFLFLCAVVGFVAWTGRCRYMDELDDFAGWRRPDERDD